MTSGYRLSFSTIAVFLGVLSLALYSHISGSDIHIVKNVIDGDSIVLDDGRHIRLIGVDAPEVDSPYKKSAPFGEESRAYLKNLLEKKPVTIKYGSQRYDKYNRTLAYVYLNNTMANAKIICDGYARAYRKFSFPEKDLFVAYEKEARAKGLGMWSNKSGFKF